MEIPVKIRRYLPRLATYSKSIIVHSAGVLVFRLAFLRRQI
jgi:hypothetical protein